MLIVSALLAMAGALYLTLIATDARPIADDWGFLGASAHLSAAGYLKHYWETASDRYSSFVLVLAFVRVFGDQAGNALSLALLALLWGCAARAVRLSAPRASRSEATVAGLLAVVAISGGAPSLYDTLGWLNSTGFYLAGFTSAAGLVCWFAQKAPGPSVGSGPFALIAFLLAAICAGFIELIGVILIVAVALGVVYIGDVVRSDRRRAAMLGLGSAAAGATTGTAVNLLGPGSRMRETAQHAHLAIAAAARTAGHNLSFVYEDLHGGVLLLAIATGMLVWRLRGAALTRHGRTWLLTWSGFLLLVPWLVTSALTAWGGSTESNDRSPFRAAFLITGSVTVAAILLTFVVLSLLPQRWRVISGAPVLVLLMAAGLFALAHKATPIVHAERLRAQALQQRAVSVNHQLAAGAETVTLRPAPLLTVYTQAYDLSFAPTTEQRSWLITFLRSYYDIPASRSVRVLARQPRVYCIANVAAPWVGVRSCQRLHGSG